MWRSRDNEKVGVLAVLAASAREAEELMRLAHLPKGSRSEAERRVRQFLDAARQMSR